MSDDTNSVNPPKGRKRFIVHTCKKEPRAERVAYVPRDYRVAFVYREKVKGTSFAVSQATIAAAEGFAKELAVATATASGQPPRKAELFLRFLLSNDVCECVLGDLEEQYRTIMVPKFGKVVADRWYWSEVVKLVGPMLWRRCKKLAVLGIVAKFFDWIVRLVP